MAGRAGRHKENGSVIWLTLQDGTPRADAETMAQVDQVFGVRPWAAVQAGHVQR